jgi:hypothetical protein
VKYGCLCVCVHARVENGVCVSVCLQGEEWVVCVSVHAQGENGVSVCVQARVKNGLCVCVCVSLCMHG